MRVKDPSLDAPNDSLRASRQNDYSPLTMGQSSTAMPGAKPYTVVYDGFCKICTRIAETLERWDGNNQMEIVSSQTPGLHARFPWIPEKSYTESLQFIGPGGRTLQAGAAVEAIIRLLPRGKWIAWIFKVPLVSGSADRVYRLIARNRYRLGCSEHCQLHKHDIDLDS